MPLTSNKFTSEVTATCQLAVYEDDNLPLTSFICNKSLTTFCRAFLVVNSTQGVGKIALTLLIPYDYVKSCAYITSYHFAVETTLQ